MGRRHADPRPSVELWGAEATSADAPRTIQVGGRTSRRGPLLAVVAAVALLAGGLALGGEDDATSGAPREERDNRLRDELKPPVVGGRATTTSRPPPTTSTSTTLVTGPVLPVQTGAALLLSDTSNRWTWLELDTGLRRDVELEISDPYALVPVAGGVVAIAGETAEYHPLPEGEPVSLGEADQVLSSGAPDTVWLVRTTFDGQTMEGSDAVLVDLAGGARSGVVQLPAAYPMGGTDRGLVFSRGGRTYLAEESGIRPLALGDALRNNRTSVFVLACNDQAVCAPEIVDVATGRSRRLAPIPNPYELGVSVILSDTGDRFAIITYRGSGQSVQIYDGAGTLLGSVELSVQSEPRWLPDDLGLVGAESGGNGVVWVSVVDGGLLVEPIRALEGQYGDFVYVIPR